MTKTKIYESGFKKKIVQLYSEEGCTIKSLNEEFQLGDGTVNLVLQKYKFTITLNYVLDIEDAKKLQE